MNTPLLEIQGLSKTYGGKKALSNFSLSIEPSEIVALLGANGSGKTTTIKSVCSLIEYEQGEIFFKQKNIKNSSKYLRHLGAVLEGSRNVHWRLTAVQNAEYFSTLGGGQWKQCRKVVEEVIELIGLGPYMHLEVGKMSTGNRQKVSILCALAHQPELLLLDEPTIGLDVDTVTQIKKFILAQARSHEQSFLICSHDLPFIDEICDRVIVLYEGTKLFDGGLDELKRKLYQFELVLESKTEIRPDQRERIARSIPEEKAKVEFDMRSVHVYFNDSETGLIVASQAYNAGIRAKDLQVKQISIEKAYTEFVKRRELDA